MRTSCSQDLPWLVTISPDCASTPSKRCGSPPAMVRPITHTKPRTTKRTRCSGARSSADERQDRRHADESAVAIYFLLDRCDYVLFEPTVRANLDAGTVRAERSLPAPAQPAVDD